MLYHQSLYLFLGNSSESKGKSMSGYIIPGIIFICICLGILEMVHQVVIFVPFKNDIVVNAV